MTTKGFKRQGAGGDYTYDANGNLKTDPNKGITLIEYNHLNLPMKVTFNTGSTIEWLYDASGRKLRKTAIAASSTIGVNGQPIAPGTYISTGLLTSTGLVSANTSVTLKGKLGVELLPNFETQPNSTFEAAQDAAITGDIQDYVDGIEYKNGAFEAIYHAEGRVTMINGALKYEYALKDHLGNTRLLFSDKDNNGVISQNANQELSEVTQEQHFYAFGMAMEGTWSNTLSVTDNKYQFGGKELNSDFGLEWMDFGARQYDAALGRWTSVDPLSEAMRRYSPYNYAFDNPMRFIDPTGMAPTDGYGEIQGPAVVEYSGPDEKAGLGKKNTTEKNTTSTQKQNRTKVEVNGVLLSDTADDGSDSEKVTFATILANYSHNNVHMKGGKKEYGNHCAVDLSNCLIKSGISLKGFKGATCNGGCSLGKGKSHALRATELAEWLTNNPFEGLPEAQVYTGKTFEAGIADKTGIVYFENYWQRDSEKGTTGRSGDHIDLWNAGTLASNGVIMSWVRRNFSGVAERYLDSSDLKRSSRVLFWEIK